MVQTKKIDDRVEKSSKPVNAWLPPSMTVWRQERSTPPPGGNPALHLPSVAAADQIRRFQRVNLHDFEIVNMGDSSTYCCPV